VESQVESCEHQDNANIHCQPFPESVPEEHKIYTDYDGCHRHHVKHDSYLFAHFSSSMALIALLHLRGFFGLRFFEELHNIRNIEEPIRYAGFWMLRRNLRRHVLILAEDPRPQLIELQAVSRKIPQHVVLIISTHLADVNQQTHHGLFEETPGGAIQ